MGWMETGMAKTRAVASDARADLAEVDSKLTGAQAWLTMSTAIDAAARKVATTWPVSLDPAAPIAQTLTAQTGALRSRAVATVDELQAERAAATSRLSFAEKSRHAMTRIAEESDKILGD